MINLREKQGVRYCEDCTERRRLDAIEKEELKEVFAKRELEEASAPPKPEYILNRGKKCPHERSTWTYTSQFGWLCTRCF